MRVTRLLALGLLTAACAERPEPIETGMAESERHLPSEVRFVHAATGAGPLTMYRETAPASDPLAYLDVTPWLPVAGGEGRLGVVEARHPGAAPLEEVRERFESDQRYLVVVYDDGGRVRTRVLDELAESDPARARLRVVNLMHDGPDLELFVRGGRDRLLDDIESGEVEEGWVSPSDRALEFRIQGERAPYLLVPNLRLAGGRGYTLVVTGTEARPDLVRILP